jgi:hypothetical protein
MAGPGMLRADAVVAFHAALREVATTHVPKLHPPGLLHGNTITLVSICGDTGVTTFHLTTAIINTGRQTPNLRPVFQTLSTTFDCVVWYNRTNRVVTKWYTWKLNQSHLK